MSQPTAINVQEGDDPRDLSPEAIERLCRAYTLLHAWAARQRREQAAQGDQSATGGDDAPDA